MAGKRGWRRRRLLTWRLLVLVSLPIVTILALDVAIRESAQDAWWFPAEGSRCRGTDGQDDPRFGSAGDIPYR
jgi:hypothetical protein